MLTFLVCTWADVQSKVFTETSGLFVLNTTYRNTTNLNCTHFSCKTANRTDLRQLDIMKIKIKKVQVVYVKTWSLEREFPPSSANLVGWNATMLHAPVAISCGISNVWSSSPLSWKTLILGGDPMQPTAKQSSCLGSHMAWILGQLLTRFVCLSTTQIHNDHAHQCVHTKNSYMHTKAKCHN